MARIARDGRIERKAGDPGGFAALASLVDPARPLVIQTHDYPDIDAVASAWALAELLRRRGRSASCVYQGVIKSRSLAGLIAELGMGVSRVPPSGEDLQIIVVDGCPTNGNVTLFPGKLIGVVDHHYKSSEPDAPFVDIRPEFAACSTMIMGYWTDAGEKLPRDLATALLAGIQSDTDFLSNRASEADFEAYTVLFRAGDWERSSRIVRTVLDLDELDLVVKALSSAVTRNGLFYATVPGPCGQEALAVLAEFVLRAEELRVAVVVEPDDGGVHLSVRSKSSLVSAFGLVRRALEGIGSGGGHAHSAGGVVPASTFPGNAALMEKFFDLAAGMSAQILEP